MRASYHAPRLQDRTQGTHNGIAALKCEERALPLRCHPRLGFQANDGFVQIVQSFFGVRGVLLEQGFSALTGGAQLRDAAVARCAVQTVNAFDQRLYILVGPRRTDGLAVGGQRGQQHGQHVGGEIRLARSRRSPSS